MKFEWKYETFHLRKFICKCRLRKRWPFCAGGDEFNRRWSLAPVESLHPTWYNGCSALMSFKSCWQKGSPGMGYRYNSLHIYTLKYYACCGRITSFCYGSIMVDFIHVFQDYTLALEQPYHRLSIFQCSKTKNPKGTFACAFKYAYSFGS